MQFSMKLFVSLVLPAAITIIVSFLWMKKRSKEAEDLDEIEGDGNVNSESAGKLHAHLEGVFVMADAF